MQTHLRLVKPAESGYFAEQIESLEVARERLSKAVDAANESSKEAFEMFLKMREALQRKYPNTTHQTTS